MNKTNRGGVIAAPKKIISLILAAVMLLLVAGVIGYFVSEPSVGGTVTELPPVMDGDGNGMDPSKVHELPSQLVFTRSFTGGVNDSYQGSVNLRATVKPSDAIDTRVDWSVAFMNPESEWAKGKTVTNYVTVTPTSDGSKDAEVTCKGEFAEPVLITVRSRSNTNASATCQVDFRQKFLGFKVTLENRFNQTPLEWFQPDKYSSDKETLTNAVKASFMDETDTKITASAEFTSVYTLPAIEAADLVITGIDITMTRDFFDVLSDAELYAIAVENLAHIDGTYSTSVKNIFDGSWMELLRATGVSGRNKLINALAGYNGAAYTIGIELNNSGNADVQFQITIDTSLIVSQKGVESVTLGDSTLEF